MGPAAAAEMEGGDRCCCGSSGAVSLCFRILVLATAFAAGGRWPSVQLEPTLTIRRGTAADVNPNITGLEEAVSHCTVRQVPETAHLSCGDLRPSTVHCSSQRSLVYHHYGCSSNRTLLHLQVLVSRNDSAAEEEHYVRFLSIEVVVEDIGSRLVQLEATRRLSEGYEFTQLTPVFPPEWVGKCYYRIVRYLLPTAEVLGMVSSPLPCGYIPRESFLLLEDAHQNRSILMEITGTRPGVPEKLRVVLFANSTALEEPRDLPHTTLQVLQLSHTPVPPETLHCPHSFYQCTYVFPVLPAGAFVPAYSSSKPQSGVTRFTSEDIAAGTVVFVPNNEPFAHAAFPPTVTATYEYTVLDYADHMLAHSAVEVSVMSVDWSHPSLRFVTSPRVEWGGHVALTDRHLQFYIPPSSFCTENTVISLHRGPSQGTWNFAGSGGSVMPRVSGRSLAIGETFPHALLRNGTLVYQHSGNGSSVADASTWNITCGGSTFQLTMTLLIIPEKTSWAPALKVQPSTLITFCGRASPLLLDIPQYPDHNVHFSVNVSQGAVVRLSSVPDTLSAHPLPPYIVSSSLVLNERVMDFSFEELEHRLIWYIPPCSPSNSLEVSVVDEQHSAIHTPVRLLVLHATVTVEEFFLLSTVRNFLRVVKNQPLPIASPETAVYITTSFLYTRSHGDSASSVMYKVLRPLQYGCLCLASLQPHLCTTSVSQFTQDDLDRFKIIYRPLNKSYSVFRQNNDSFVFELCHRGMRLAQPLTGTFHLFAAQAKPVVMSEDQLWTETGDVLTIPLRLFRNSAIQPHRRATFQLLTLPQFGKLFMANGSPQTVVNSHSYTFEELRSGRLQYNYTGLIQSCNDSFTFLASNATHDASEMVVIAIRERQDNLLGMWSETKSVLDQETFVFTSQDFHALSDFCPEFVQFTVREGPMFGSLRLFQPSLHTFVQLRNGSVFSAEDVSDGRLWYSSSHHSHLNTSILNTQTNSFEAMKFYLSDPKNYQEPNYGRSRIEINFEVTFFQPTEYHIHTVFNTRDVYTLSWIPELGRFGYVFQPDDVRVESTPSLEESDISVKILVKESPRKGWIRRHGQPVTEFYLRQLQNREIYYVPNNWWIWVATSDSFTMSVLLETSNASFFVNTIYNHSMALVWSWVGPAQLSHSVSESVTTLEILFRRQVDNGTCPGYESSFSLTLSPTSTATLTTSNCSEIDGSEVWTEDACIDSLQLSFSPGECETSVSVWLRQDLVLEGPETLLLYITDCSNCVSNISQSQPMGIVIDDTHDYAYIDVDATRTESVAYGCSREMNIREHDSQLVLELTRSGNTQTEATVTCLTQGDTATNNVDFEQTEETVTFAPFETRTRCTVEIYDDSIYEGKERFYVYVRSRAGQLVNSTLEETPLCIYIVYDPNDAPIVSFQRQPLVVSETDSASFSIQRSGFNLHLPTTACYHLLLNGTLPAATLSLDFTLMSDCVQSHDHWCVTFSPNATRTRCSVFARQDDLLEGTETVFLELQSRLQFGELGQPAQLNISILDRTEPAHIGLASDAFHIDEAEGLQRFPISRSGSINGVNKILCKLKPIDATAQITDQKRADFVVPRTPETVTFHPFNTTEYCSMWLRDDSVYEGVERLYLELDYSPQDPQVQIIPSRKRATIYIHDTQDEPDVWFAFPSYTVQEPISNFDVDQRYALLTLQRGGDTSGPATATYTTLADSAHPGEHYLPVNGTVLFEAGQETRNITIPILASKDSRQVSFTVRLLGNVTTPTNSAPLLAVVMEQNEASVVILNTPLTGVLFPDRPAVLSLLPNGTYGTGSSLYYNAPVVCVDPCDEDFPVVNEEASSYAEYCRDQQIDSQLTKYTWFISASPTSQDFDNINYLPVEQATIFTTFDGKVLEPVYLSRDVYLRCSAQAITRLGTQGGTRLSKGVQLSRSVLSSPQDTCGKVSSFFELHTNDGFTGHPEELLRLTVVLKHHDNHVPLVSSRSFDFSDPDLFLSLLTRPFSRDQHSCSSLVESGPDKASFLSLPSSFPSSSPQPSNTRRVRAEKSHFLYQHLNASKCEWEFSVWLPLSLLLDTAVCGGELSQEDHRLTLTLRLHHAYVHLHRDRGVSVLQPDTGGDIVRTSWPSGHRLSIPFDTYPHTQSGSIDNTSSTYIYPIATRFSLGRRFSITFYSVSNFSVISIEAKFKTLSLPARLLYSSSSSSSLSSAATASSVGLVRQAWMLAEVPQDEMGTFSLSLWPHECSITTTSGGLCRHPLSFTWSIATTDLLEPYVAPQLDGLVDISDGLIEAAIWLRPYFCLRANHTISLDRATLYLCAESNDNSSCTNSQIWELANRDQQVVLAGEFEMTTVAKTATALNFTIKSRPLRELELTGNFQLHVKFSISNSSEGPNAARSPILPLVLSFHLQGPGQGLTPPLTTGVSHNIALLASSITIFVTAAALVAVLLVVVGLLCRWQARHKRARSRDCAGDSGTVVQGRAGESQSCALTGRQHSTSNTSTNAKLKLKKSSSTTSFPTAEKLKTAKTRQLEQQQEQSGHYDENTLHSSTTSQMTGQISRHHILSKSLPNLFLVSAREARLGRKRQLRKNVRVKAIYSLQASLDKRRGKITAVRGEGEGKYREEEKDSSRAATLKQTAEVVVGDREDESNLQACVIKNSAAPPVMVRVQPLTGEVDHSRHSTASDLKPEELTASTEP